MYTGLMVIPVLWDDTYHDTAVQGDNMHVILLQYQNKTAYHTLVVIALALEAGVCLYTVK